MITGAILWLTFCLFVCTDKICKAIRDQKE